LNRLFSIVALAALLTALVPSSSLVQAQTSSPDYGASVFLLGHAETTARDIALARQAGLHWIKMAVPWRSIEPSCKNCIDWDDLDRVVGAASAAGLNILVRVDHQPAWSRVTAVDNGPPDDVYDYADFVSVLARRYRLGSPKGTIQAIEVWNEPNLNREWGGAIVDKNQAAQYVFMLKQTYQAVKAEDPSKIIVSAGLSPTGTNDGTAQPDDVYLGWLYEQGLAKYSDAIGVHGAGFSPPEAEIGSNPNIAADAAHNFAYFRRVEQLHNIMVANGDVNKQIWLLEFGWTTDQVHSEYAWFAVTPEQQADYVVRAYQYARTNWAPWIGPMFVWNFADPSWTPDVEQYWWSITNPDGTTRPAFDRLAAARSSGQLP
jgi:hypothetical protein